MSNMEKMPDNHDGITGINSFAEAMRDVEPFKAPESTQGEVGEKDQNLEKTRRILIEKYAAKVLNRHTDKVSGVEGLIRRNDGDGIEAHFERAMKECGVEGGGDNIYNRFMFSEDVADSYRVALLCLAGSEDALKKVDEMSLPEGLTNLEERGGYYETRYENHKEIGGDKGRRLILNGSRIIKAAIPAVIKKRYVEPRKSLEDKFKSIEKTLK